MTGALIIDEVDVYTTYGVYVVDGGWNDLVAFPPLKSVDSNDWHEYDGIEPDLSDPVLNTKDIQMTFAIVGSFSGYLSFIEFLADGAYHEFTCIGRTFKLRLTQEPNHTVAQTLGRFTLKLADDFPMKRSETTYTSPSSTMTASNAYKLGSNRFSAYGIRVLQGSIAEVLKTASVKQNLLRNIASQSGVIYDEDGDVKLQAKDVKLTCLMRASSLTQFWRNHDAFLYDLIRPNERSLYVADTGNTYKCHYKSSTVSEFFPEGTIWMRFTLTLTFTRDFR